ARRRAGAPGHRPTVGQSASGPPQAHPIAAGPSLDKRFCRAAGHCKTAWRRARRCPWRPAAKRDELVLFRPGPGRRSRASSA
nr:hypothetical protein [Tanacetum cinerariifolium]